MPYSATLRECFRHNDWAREKLLTAAAALSASDLDHVFDMGFGSLRGTLHHLWTVEASWLARWLKPSQMPVTTGQPHDNVAELAVAWRATAQERDNFLNALGEDGLARTITYTNSRGVTATFSYAQMALQVCNHGVHHRAQAVNMLRHVGAELPRPGVDYIFMKVEEGLGLPTAQNVAALRDYYAYGDWAQARLHAIARELPDAALDRPFAIGCGGLRTNLAHIRFAEQWWLENWVHGPGRPFPETDPAIPVAELERLFAETATARNAILANTSDADLDRIVSAIPRPGVERRFPLGVTMLQLCTHGTHHRAQAINMLRQLGVVPPELDYVIMVRERA